MAAQDIHAHRILVLDFGSQYTQLIARRIRGIGVFCEIHPFDVSEDVIRAFNPRGVILSGGPESVHVNDSPRAPQLVFDLQIPVLGVCYGMQTMAQQLGGQVQGSNVREFGAARVNVVSDNPLLDGLRDAATAASASGLDVWMSHGDKVTALPDGFTTIASTDSCPIAGMADVARQYYGVQFHPEVTHTKQGAEILSRFVLDICACEALWTPANIVDDAIANVRAQVGDRKVLLGLSGGVDSSVVAA
ncbi:MAG: glutamine-hydrolyzing GMP synthase, partial [Thiopseudomonas sp.]|nr:glutamine-hydrolyzing GMP synthase [Thiopseudomonas sp.]MBP9614677.1 glutamine-hydrolyzing GMP synthase [Thiopseudomonas sp.]